MKAYILALLIGSISGPLFGQTGPAPATIKKRVVTSSGDPEMILPGNISDTRARLAGLCQKLSWSPRLQGSLGMLACDVPSNERTVVATSGTYDLQLVIERRPASVPVRKQVNFYLSPSRGETLVRARAMRLFPPIGGGTPTRKYMDDENTFNGLINIMALIGGRFSPGTSFRNVGYLGFRSDEVINRKTSSGTQRTAIVVGAIEEGSPSAAAGLRVGDLILDINDQSFGDYEGAAKIMAKLRPGDAVRVMIERDSKPHVIAMVAAAPMAIR